MPQPLRHINLIVDAGSTKTLWAFLDGNGHPVKQFTTEGINCKTLPDKQIYSCIQKAASNISGNWIVDNIYFYGAGCLDGDTSCRIKNLLSLFWNGASISAESDLLGAARALFGQNNGIVCILGTGSNSGLYAHGNIEFKIPSLGYILGDEGSGAALGKRLINSVMKRGVSQDVANLFYSEFNLSESEIIEKVYKGNYPNSFLASFAIFLKRNIKIPELNNLVIKEFDNFFLKNIIKYPYYKNYKIKFVGSIAENFKDQLIKSGLNHNLVIKAEDIKKTR